MKEIEFKMERPDLLHIGDKVEVEESQLVTLQGVVCYYTIIPALAMSNNIPYREHMKRFRTRWHSAYKSMYFREWG